MPHELRDLQQRYEQAEDAIVDLLTDNDRCPEWEHVAELLQRLASDAIKYGALLWVDHAEMAEIARDMWQARLHQAEQAPKVCVYCGRDRAHTEAESQEW
jgi:hypothetical protein